MVGIWTLPSWVAGSEAIVVLSVLGIIFSLLSFLIIFLHSVNLMYEFSSFKGIENLSFIFSISSLLLISILQISFSSNLGFICLVTLQFLIKFFYCENKLFLLLVFDLFLLHNQIFHLNEIVLGNLLETYYQKGFYGLH